MKKPLVLVLVAGALSSLTGCSAYAGAAAASNDRVVVAVNNGFLGGVFRKIYVCKVTDGGLSSCQTAESP